MNWGFCVMRFCFVLLVACSLGAFGPACLAQALLAPDHPNFSTSGSGKAHAGKKTDAVAAPKSEAAEKAAHVAAGRKKFFERSMGFDNGGASNSPVSLGDDGRITPSAGFKF
jgi:hypothetical protein